ncbi:MAG TPA: glycosyltransferase family A protein, partial [Acidimicrobiia bacterium]|nr:glycosyltransferase family A protein [Acidimicrobiia bacterium]
MNQADPSRLLLVMVVEGESPTALAALQALAEHTPDDAYDAVVVGRGATGAGRTALDAVEGDATVLDAGSEGPLGSALRAACSPFPTSDVALVGTRTAVTDGWLDAMRSLAERAGDGVAVGREPRGDDALVLVRRPAFDAATAPGLPAHLVESLDDLVGAVERQGATVVRADAPVGDAFPAPGSSAPAVSVLVPMYNRVDYLRACLEGVLDQDFTDLELVACDDRSTDGAWELLQEIGPGDDRLVRLRNDENLGVLGNMRRLYRRARGEFVKFLMADDVVFPGSLARQVEALRRHSQAVLTTSSTQLVGPDGEPLENQDRGWNHAITEQAGIIRGRELIESVLANRRNVIGTPSAVLFRREALPLDVFDRAFDGHVANAFDVGMWVQLLSRGDAYYVPEPLNAYRVHSDALSEDPEVALQVDSDWLEVTDDAVAAGLFSDPRAEVLARANYLAVMSARVAYHLASHEEIPHSDGFHRLVRHMAQAAG